MAIRRICHLSDTHLGYSEYGKISPVSGLNQREQDFYDAWNSAIVQILALSPDLVVHAGDLFHTPRPSNRAIRIALEGLQKISRAGIPVVLVSGNHETPRIRSTGSIFESLALFPGVSPSYQSRYEALVIEELAIHAIPHCSLSEELEAASRAITIDPRIPQHMLVTHGVWTRTESFSMGEFNEQRLPDFTLLFPDTFAYIALGHYHRRVDIAPRVSYCGASERTSLNQAGYPCGFLEVDLFSGDRIWHEIAARPMLRLKPVDCRGLRLQEIYDRTAAAAVAMPGGAIVQLTLQNVEESIYFNLEMRLLEEIFPDAFQLEKVIQIAASRLSSQETSLHFDSLAVEFGRYLEGEPELELDHDRLRQLGGRYLDEEPE